MPTGWNGTPTQQDVFDITYLRMIWAGFFMRASALANNSYQNVYSLPSAGDQVSSAAVTAPAYLSGSSGPRRYNVNFIQQFLQANAPNFVRQGIDLENVIHWYPYRGTPTSPFLSDIFIFTVSAWRSLAGLPSAGFTRKRPREIASTSATVDFHSNPRATGQIAWLRVAPFGLHQFDGTAWLPIASGIPDLIASNQASPSTMPYGVFQHGDYYGGWLYEEIVKGLNVLTRTWKIGRSAATGIDPNVPGATLLGFDSKTSGQTTTEALAVSAYNAASIIANSMSNPFSERYFRVGWSINSSGNYFYLAQVAKPSASAWCGRSSKMYFLWADISSPLVDDTYFPGTGNQYTFVFEDGGIGISRNGPVVDATKTYELYEMVDVAQVSEGTVSTISPSRSSYWDFATVSTAPTYGPHQHFKEFTATFDAFQDWEAGFAGFNSAA